MRRRADVAILGDGKVLYLSGSPHEQGKQLGRGAADLIRENVRQATLLRTRVTVVVDFSRADRAWHILNWQPVLRRARSVDEALDMIREQPRVAGMNAMLADANKAVAVEVTDNRVQVFEPDDGILVRTNHFLSPALQHLAPTVEENRGTFDRYQRAHMLATERRGSINHMDLVRILSDHSKPPVESICRHDGPGRTYAATVVCTQDRTMWTAFGNPCEGMQAVGRPGE